MSRCVHHLPIVSTDHSVSAGFVFQQQHISQVPVMFCGCHKNPYTVNGIDHAQTMAKGNTNLITMEIPGKYDVKIQHHD